MVRSERQLIERLNHNLLFRWFIGRGMDVAVWLPTVFSKDRDRRLVAEIARKLMAQLLGHKEVRSLLSDDHFSADVILIEAWASMKCFQSKPAPPEPRSGRDPAGAERKPEGTPASTTTETPKPQAVITPPAMTNQDT